MLTFRDFVSGLRELGIERSSPVIAHASLSAFGEVHGGAQTVLGALTSVFDTLIMPTFTYKTMITPVVGPPDNALVYGSGKDANRMAEIYSPDMPADALMGRLSETLRSHPKAVRSTHPILSFAGLNAHNILRSQTIEEPLLPLKLLRDEGGWVLLMGVDHTVNTSIHLGEQLAGRKQFIRWALTPRGIIPCQGFPGCSNGFAPIGSQLDGCTQKIDLGQAEIQAIPLANLMDSVCALLQRDPLALLCSRADCERCNAVREAIRQSPQG